MSVEGLDLSSAKAFRWSARASAATRVACVSMARGPNCNPNLCYLRSYNCREGLALSSSKAFRWSASARAAALIACVSMARV